MKFAIIADIHANLDAFQVVLEDIKQQKCTHYACLGDVVGYNANPKDAVMEAARRAGARIVKPAQDTFWGGYAGYFQDPDQHLWEVAWNPQWSPPE